MIEIVKTLISGVVTLILKRFPNGMVRSNCYVIGDSGEAAVIDPGVESTEILKFTDAENLKIKYIILTHVHVDHILYVDELRLKTGGKVAAHEEDAKVLGDPWYNGSMLFGLNYSFNNADILLKDGDVLEIGNLKLEIIHTPGHTPGGICIKTGNLLFTGDTLFRETIGRCDLGSGNQEDMKKSLDKLMKMPPDTVIYPGHGTSSTIGYEKENNPFI